MASKNGDDRAKRQNRSRQTTKKNGEIKASNLNPQDKRYIQRYANKLSPTTKRAKWVHSPREHEDRNGQSLATRDHQVIEHWAKERNAQPATVPGTEHGNRLGVLRLDFRGYGGRQLEKVSWDQWFKTFDSRKLTFLFQEHLRNGQMSNFFKLDSPEREHD